MKRNSIKYISHCKYLLFAVLFCALLHSCDIETSSNGKLDGFWHLVAIDTIATSVTRDMSNEKIYWSFENKLLELDDRTGVNSSILFRFEHIGGALHLYDPYLYDRDNGDTPIYDVQMVLPFGVENTEITYAIDVLTSKRMIIRTDNLRLSFRKL